MRGTGRCTKAYIERNRGTLLLWVLAITLNSFFALIHCFKAQPLTFTVIYIHCTSFFFSFYHPFLQSFCYISIKFLRKKNCILLQFRQMFKDIWKYSFLQGYIDIVWLLLLLLLPPPPPPPPPFLLICAQNLCLTERMQWSCRWASGTHLLMGLELYSRKLS